MNNIKIDKQTEQNNVNDQLLNLLKSDFANYKNKLDITYDNKAYEKITQNYYVYEYLRNRIESIEIFNSLNQSI